jgi:cell division protein FtsL
MQKIKIEKDLRKERYSGFFVLALIVVVAILSVGRVFVANRLVETSENLRRLDREVSDLEQQNQQLAEEVRLHESAAYVETKAVELGFQENGHYSFISPKPVAVAFR